ncbi:ubiquinone biosynthesis methyltransferase UbiE [Mycobacterium paraense]|uniref:Ubiquinone biosynthesis methyltransferase UbiE n=1 Tax=Mycobacterium paraense TaxID=767916 RepID=A0ABX3VRF0_9MYCO|nr:class I SAM-dependent methyltransferase [Mycobacterium paraense]ORW32730.1 ubiquinone biosynthesis methyltransferase UbiE [Mycobacterium paraense]ORW44955.1 ubiquinone biosynthesis methyltransferase UbiE [Mycobacterium paraense]
MPIERVNQLLKGIRKRIGEFPYPHQAAVLLDNPVRRALENPAGVIDLVGLSGYESVLELGPGPGYYSTEIAERLPIGHLDLFDLQPEMLNKARRKLLRAGYPDVGFHSGDASDQLPFSDNTFDVVFLAAVIGEVPDQQSCLRSLARVTKTDGLLVFVEGFPDPDRLSVAQLRHLAEPAGFALLDAKESRWRDIVRFRKLTGV